MSNLKKIYFTAGPAPIPDEVKQEIKRDYCNYNGLDIGVGEISHRSATFESILSELETDLRKLMRVPENYSILFMHGGATTQFASVPMNLCPELNKYSAEYIVNGSWSKKAADEAEKYVTVKRQTFNDKKSAPSKEQLVAEDDVSYRYYCDNETIQGIEFDYIPAASAKVPLVTDMTSNFLSKPIDVSKYGVIFASVQKNFGLAGLAIVIVRNDLLGRHMPIVSSVQCYEVTKKNRSLLNTPLTFNIYVAGVYCKWILARGGLEGMDRLSREKSSLIYELVDNSGGFYSCPVEKKWRSRMNVVFLLGDKSLESKFLDDAKAVGLNELKGHRSVGGCRASLYHGISLEDVKRLTQFMIDFQRRHQA